MENPKLLKCIYYKNEIFSTQDKRIVKDYEFDLYLEGGRTIYINNKKYNIEPHNLVFRKPGDIVCGEGTFDCYMLTLDFSNNSSDSDYSRNKLGMQQPLTQNYLLSALSPGRAEWFGCHLYLANFYMPQNRTQEQCRLLRRTPLNRALCR